ncbi:MAG TPA: hypothetical protein VMX56_00530 [Anaerolineales bacterium]|nr:hypothetical protein [Anaerolineales bacterium]
MDWRNALEPFQANSVSKSLAILSGVSVFFPWFVRETFSVHSPPGILLNVIVPPHSFSLIYAAADFFGGGGIPNIPSIAALTFVLGAIIAWWSPVGGLLQIGSVYAIAISIARVDYLLYNGTLEAEYSLGIGFHIGFIFALGTVFSLCPSSRSALIRTIRTVCRRLRSRVG